MPPGCKPVQRAGIALTLLFAVLGAPAGANDFDQAATAFKNKDYDAALLGWRPMAKAGNPAAQYNLGLMYAHGFGVARDDALAVEWYRMAAAQGYAKAQHNLAVHYQNGRGVARDYAAAARWYRKAAEQGEAAAQNNLAMLCLQGLGVEKDRVQAVQWAARAARQGNAAAKRNLDRLLETLPRLEVAGSDVNVRARPGGEILLQSDEGAGVRVLATRDDWKQIVFVHGYAVGWIAGFLLRTPQQSGSEIAR